MRSLKRIYTKLVLRTGATGDMDPLESEICCTLGGNKHLQPKMIGSSSSGIMVRGNYMLK